MIKSILALLVFSFSACQSQKAQQTDTHAQSADQEEEVCIAFDQRQCQTDAFATFLPSDKNSDGMFEGMQSYLADQGIKVLHMRIDMNFHEFTCAACDVCPESHRFFLSLSKSEERKLQNLNLLNLISVDCQEHF